VESLLALDMTRSSAYIIKHAQLAEGSFVLPNANAQPQARAAQTEEPAATPAPQPIPASLTPVELAHARQESYQEGFEAGLRQGRAEAVREQQDLRRALHQELAAAQDAQTACDAENAETKARAITLDQQLQTLDGVLRAVDQAKSQLLTEAEDDLLAICLDLAGQVFETSVLSPEALHSLVCQAVVAFGRQTSITVHLHPQDLDWLKRSLPGGMPTKFGDVQAVGWTADAQVELGGCILHGEQAALDARLEQQLTALRARLMDLRKQRDEEVNP
jgi:flagellar assembly protein FliH